MKKGERISQKKNSFFIFSSLKYMIKHNKYFSEKVKLPFKYFFSKYKQIQSFLWISSHLLSQYLIETFFFCGDRFLSLDV